MTYSIDGEVLDSFQSLLEDTISYFCDENMVSGELAWILTQTYAETKQAEMRGEIDANPVT